MKRRAIAVWPFDELMGSAILAFLLDNRTALLDLLFDVVQHLPLISKLPGIYKVLSYDADLVLLDRALDGDVKDQPEQIPF